jgi:hypothetical protein
MEEWRVELAASIQVKSLMRTRSGSRSSKVSSQVEPKKGNQSNGNSNWLKEQEEAEIDVKPH